MVRTWHFHCCGLGSIPDRGTKILQAKRQKKKKNGDLKYLPSELSMKNKVKLGTL